MNPAVDVCVRGIGHWLPGTGISMPDDCNEVGKICDEQKLKGSCQSLRLREGYVSPASRRLQMRVLGAEMATGSQIPIHRLF